MRSNNRKALHLRVTNYGVIGISEPVMGPIIAILTGALLIAVGVYSAALMIAWIGIVVSIAGVATILVGLAMLVALAKRPTVDQRKKR